MQFGCSWFSVTRACRSAATATSLNRPSLSNLTVWAASTTSTNSLCAFLRESSRLDAPAHDHATVHAMLSVKLCMRMQVKQSCTAVITTIHARV
jgi:hypothetical protein